MRYPLTPGEQAALRRLEEEISREDPGLAARLRRHGGASMRRVSPLRWPPPVYASIGALLLLSGVVLGVGSAVLAGLAALGVAVYRSAACRRIIARTLSGLDGWSRR